MLTPRTLCGATALALAAALLAAGWSTGAAALPERKLDTTSDLLARLRVNTGNNLIQQQLLSDSYLALHAAGSQPLLSDNAIAEPLERARFFLSIYGAIAGVNDAVNELSLRRVTRDRAGNTHVHLDQMHNGLPVFGARTVVHMNDAGITGTNGVFVPGLSGLSTTPALSIASLHQRALAAAGKLHPNSSSLKIASGRLMIYRDGLLLGVTGKSLLAYEAMVQGAQTEAIRERIILDANSGALLNRINEIHTVLNREIYTPDTTVPPLLTEGSVLAPADIPLTGDGPSDPASRLPRLPTDNLYIFAGGTYALYKNLFGREGYDDGALPPEEQVQRSVYLINENCPNAYWNGTSTNYCPGFDADDVVSHEWSHAYTEYTHGLIYQYQSGALNEAYSDIFGETYDLVNGIEGPLGVTLTEGEYFENGGSRWVVGEDLSETAAGLLLRDMWDPDNFTVNVPVLNLPLLSFAPSPGSVITSENYYCGTGDGGGVHTNSGVPNHAYAMLVDGKEFNGVVIPKIGMTKAAHIYFHAQTHYQTPTTNFPQHADALEQSCRDLIGAPLNDVLGNDSGERIGNADCAAVAAAMQAVEMRSRPHEKCGYIPVLQPENSTPALCPEGQAPEPSFHQNWEGSQFPADWTLGKNLTGDTESAIFAFELTGELPAPHGGRAAFALNDTGGTCAVGGDQSGSHWMDSPELTLTDASNFLHFSHFMQSEAGYDGGNLKYSLNGADFVVVPDDAFTYNGHSSVLNDGPLIPGTPDPIFNNTNPMAGQAAWSGSDQGESTGSWGVTVVDIAALGAASGDKIRFRWEFGNDGCGGNRGWYIDDTTVFSCKAGGSGIPSPTPGTGGGTGGDGGGSTGGGSTDGGRFGGGAFGGLLLLPLFGAAALRRRRH